MWSVVRGALAKKKYFSGWAKAQASLLENEPSGEDCRLFSTKDSRGGYMTGVRIGERSLSVNTLEKSLGLFAPARLE
jgi:hypothetical protein